MEKKILLIAATFLAKLVWKFGKISSGPLRLIVFWVVQAILAVFIKKIMRIWSEHKKTPGRQTISKKFRSTCPLILETGQSFTTRLFIQGLLQ